MHTPLIDDEVTNYTRFAANQIMDQRGGSTMGGPLFRVLVVDDEPAIRALIIRALEMQQIACTPASDGQEADDLMSINTFDAVVTDLRMPNRHGHALASELLAAHDRPLVVVVTGVLEPRLAKDLLHRGVDDIHFKPVNYSLLATKLRAQLDRRHAAQLTTSAAKLAGARGVGTAGTNGVDRIDRDDFFSRLAHVATILPVSKVAIDVINLTSRSDVDAEKLTACLVRDASLAVEILKMANSAFYRRPQAAQIDELRDAVVRIGFKRVGELALASSTLSTLTSSVLPWVDVSLLWRRSMAGGLVIERLNSKTTLGGEDEGLFLSALVRPLGRIVLGTIYPREYDNMIVRCHTSRAALSTLEEQVFPETECQAMAHLLSTWTIPEEVFLPLRHATLDFNELKSLSEPLRTKIAMLKLATIIGELTVGRWEGWELIDIPPTHAFHNLPADRLYEEIEQVRRDLQELEALCKLPHFVPRTPGQLDDGAPDSFAYCNLSFTTTDVLAHYLDSLGFPYVSIDREALPRETRPVLVNCCGGITERAGELLRQLDTNVPRVLVVDHVPSPSLSSSGDLLTMPCSYAALRDRCQQLDELAKNANGRRLAASVSASYS